MIWRGTMSTLQRQHLEEKPYKGKRRDLYTTESGLLPVEKSNRDIGKTMLRYNGSKSWESRKI